MKVHYNKSYAPEAYSFNLCDISGMFANQVIRSIPQVHSGITGCHIIAMMILVEKSSRTQSTINRSLSIKFNALGGLVKFASPSTYAELEVAFLLALRDKTLHVFLLCYTMLNCLPLLGPKQSDSCPQLNE